MTLSDYSMHLHQSILNKRENSIKQIGQSDIEPSNFRKLIENWYTSLILKIDSKAPQFYVRAVNVYERNSAIVKIEYIYYEKSSDVGDTHIIIHTMV